MFNSPEEQQQAVEYSRRQFHQWTTAGLIQPEELSRILAYLHRVAQRDTAAEQTGGDQHSPEAQATTTSEFLIRQLQEIQEWGILAAETVDRLIGQVRLAEFEAARQQDVRSAASRSGTASPEPEAKAQRPALLVRMLDPHSLQMLMFCGGGLLVLGLVLWLWSIGIFENRLVMAVSLGSVNGGLIAAGVSLVRLTRYRLAGRGLALLGCLVMPLNLWFYDAQGLITLAEGGHLWIPALLICLIYAAVVRILKDPLFVFTLVGGVALSGLLFLADQRVDRFWEIISPAALLIVLGVVCIHLERLFAETAEVFRRDTFGRAFFWAGHLVLPVGLAILLAGRVVGLLFVPVFAELEWFSIPDVAVVRHIQAVALLLTLGASYAYAYSYLAVRAARRFVGAALLTFLWSEVILLDVLGIPLTYSAVLLLSAATALLLGTSHRLIQRREHALSSGSATGFVMVGSAAAGLTALTVGAGAVQFLAELISSRVNGGLCQPEWTFVVAMGLLLITCLQLAIPSTGRVAGWLEHVFLKLTGVPLLLTLLCTLTLLGMPLPLSLVVAGTVCLAGVLVGGIRGGQKTGSEISRLSAMRNSLLTIAEVLAAQLVLLGIGLWGELLMLSGISIPHDWRVVLAAELAAVFLTLGVLRERKEMFLMAGLCGWAACWKLLVLCGVITYSPLISASLLGLCGVVAGQLLPRQSVNIGKWLEGTGTIAILLGGIAGVLLTVNRVVGGDPEWSLLGLMAFQMLVAGLNGTLTRFPEIRRGLFVVAGLHLLAGLLVINQLSVLTLLQRLEIFSIVTGLLLLIVGHLGWWREEDRENPVVSLHLYLGSLLAAVPLICGLLDHRFGGDGYSWGWVMLQEVGTLAVGLLLLGAGLLCRIRTTTLAGAAALGVYLLSLVTLIHLPQQLQHVAVYLMIGGASFFGVAVLLSVYRDRLLTMPDRIRNGEGVFRVLKWR